jgi:hypothetical protein
LFLQKLLARLAETGGKRLNCEGCINKGRACLSCDGERLKALPSDIQVAWVNSIINRYGCGLGDISVLVFGQSYGHLRNHLTRKGEIKFINKGKKGVGGIATKKSLAEAFENWKNTQITMSEEDLPQDEPDPAAVSEKATTPFAKVDPAVFFGIKHPEEEQITVETEALPETTATECEETVAPAPKNAVEQSEPLPKCFDPANIAALIAALAGSGAKLTIEVTL